MAEELRPARETKEGRTEEGVRGLNWGGSAGGGAGDGAADGSYTKRVRVDWWTAERVQGPAKRVKISFAEWIRPNLWE